jgi:hypothetical protein
MDYSDVWKAKGEVIMSLSGNTYNEKELDLALSVFVEKTSGAIRELEAVVGPLSAQALQRWSGATRRVVADCEWGKER